MSQKIKLYSVTLLLIFAALIATDRRAYGYIDPGSGLLLIQNIGAAVTGILFFFRRRIKAFFVRDKSEPQK